MKKNAKERFGFTNYLEENLDHQEAGVSQEKFDLNSITAGPIEGTKAKGMVVKIEREGSKGSVFRDIASEMQQANIPLEKRIHPQTIDSLLAQELANHGINLNYSYRISSIKEDSVIFTKALQSNQIFVPANSEKTNSYTSYIGRLKIIRLQYMEWIAFYYHLS